MVDIKGGWSAGACSERCLVFALPSRKTIFGGASAGGAGVLKLEIELELDPELASPRSDP